MKKLGCILLVLLMLLPLAACNTDSKTEPPSGENPPQEREPIDMKGYEYKAFLYDQPSSGTSWLYEGFDGFASSTDVISKAAYGRNRAIEKDYNCKITYQSVTMLNPVTEFSTLLGPGKTFELVVLDQISLVDSACMGLLRDLKNTEGLDLSGKGFDPNSVEQLTLGNALYFVSGDMNISATDKASVIVYNQNEWDAVNESVADSLGDAKYADLYGLVKAKEWTVDNMLKIAAEYTLDADPDDGLPLSHEYGDHIGYFMYYGCTTHYYFASGGRLSVKDETNFPVMALGNEESKSLYDALYEKLNVKLNPTIPTGSSVTRNDNVKSGQTLFADYLVWDVRRVLNHAKISFTYGLLPMPTVASGMTADSLVNNLGRNLSAYLWAIPVNCTNSAYAVEMLEVIAERSGEFLEIYDRSVVCKGLPATDPSYQTLANIRKTFVWDIAFAYVGYGADMDVCKAIQRLNWENGMPFDDAVTEEGVKSANDYLNGIFAPLKE